MGLGMFLGGLAGAGKGIADTGKSIADAAERAQKFSDEQALMRERAALEEQKQLRIDEVIRQRNAAPLNRLQSMAQQYAQEQVPVTADLVTKTTSAGAHAAGFSDGLIGMTRDQVLAYKDPDMLAQYDKQLSEDNRIAQESVAGKMRNRTSQEAFDSAMQNAQANDLEAFNAGTGLISAQAKNRHADNEDRRADLAEKRQSDLVEYQNREQKRRDLLAEAELSLRKSQEDNANSRTEKALQAEKINATKAALSGVNNDIKSLEKELADPMLSDQQKLVIGRQLSSARSEAASYRKALSEAGLNVPQIQSPDNQDTDPLGIRKNFGQNKKPTDSDKPRKSPNMDRETTPQSPNLQPKRDDGAVDVSNDNVIMALKSEIAKIDKTDPRNSETIMAFSRALNDRINQLKEKYGSMTKLTGY